jgi:four helix bundle protein
MTDDGRDMRIPAGHRKLKVYQEAHRLALDTHAMTLRLPQFELYEEGSQIRRSSKSVSSNIVEGFSLRHYKNLYLRYLSLSYASSQETIEHLDYLFETGSLNNEELYQKLHSEYDTLCGMLFNLIQSVHEKHETKIFGRKTGN